MKRNIIFAAAAVCVALSSCVKDKEQDFVEDQILFSASTGELETRTEYGALDDNTNPSKQHIDWKLTGDKITILMGSQSADYDVTRKTQGSGSSSKSNASISVSSGSEALRWGDGSSRTFYAMYPAAGTISYTPDGGSAVSNEVTSSGMTAVIPPASTVSELSELPHGYMFATKTASRSSSVSLEFGHHFTAFSFTLKNTSSTDLELTSFKLKSASHSLSGVYTVSTNGTYTRVSEFSKAISVTGITVPKAANSTPGEVSFTIVTFPRAFPGSGSDTFNDLSVECESNGKTKTLVLEKSGSPIPFAPLKKHNISITLPDFDDFYLSFTTSSQNTVSLTNTGNNAPNLQYSYDTVKWYTWDYSSLSLGGTNPSTVYFRGMNTSGFSKTQGSTYIYSTFTATGSGGISVSGNIMSLINYSDRTLKEIPNEYCFYRLFYATQNNKNTWLVDASHLLLPATTLKAHCYIQMFQYCTNMAGTAPELPAPTLTKKCYESMFAGCSSLRAIRVLCTDKSAENATANWISGVSGNNTDYMFYSVLPKSSWSNTSSGYYNWKYIQI